MKSYRPTPPGKIEFSTEALEEKPSTISVLMVEDQPFHSTIMTSYLTSFESSTPFDIVTVTTLQKALTHSDHWDVILLDLGLPDSKKLQGVEGLLRAKKAFPNTPIIVVSGNNQIQTALQCIRMGAQSFVCKTKLNPEDLYRTLLYSIEREKLRTQTSHNNNFLQRQAMEDPLTHLLNRRGVEMFYRQENSQRDRTSAPLSALLIDLDHFKAINDTFGHDMGDLVLKEVAQILKQNTRSTDAIGRLGGDEFFVLLPSTRLAEADTVAQKLHEKIASYDFEHEEEMVPVFCSIGGVSVRPTHSLKDTIKHLSSLLHNSKALGRNRITMEVPQEGSYPAEASFDTPYYLGVQPVFGPQKERLGFEYRLYSDNPNARILPCRSEHLPTVFEHYRSLEQPIQELYLLVDPRDFIKNCDQWLSSILLAELTATQIYFQFPLELFISSPKALQPSIEKLRSHGFKISLQQFTIASQSLESLILLEPDSIEISQSYTLDIEQNKGSQRTVEKLFHMLKLKDTLVSSRNIKSQAGLELLKQFGVQRFMGPLLASIQSLNPLLSTKTAKELNPNLEAKPIASINPATLENSDESSQDGSLS